MNDMLSPVCYAFGYLTGFIAFFCMAKKRGLATSGIMALMGAALIGGLIGAHLAQWICGGTEGKSMLGAIGFGYVSVILYKRYLGIKRPTGDLFAIAICAGEAVGRFGCFFGGCCYGLPSRVPWAVWQHGAWRHPTQIYDSLACLLILGILLAYDRKHPPENSLFYLQVSLYCIARFVIEFYRWHPDAPIDGLTVAQWACVAGFVFFSVKLILLLHHTRSLGGTALHAPMPQLWQTGH